MRERKSLRAIESGEKCECARETRVCVRRGVRDRVFVRGSMYGRESGRIHDNTLIIVSIRLRNMRQAQTDRQTAGHNR